MCKEGVGKYMRLAESNLIYIRPRMVFQLWKPHSRAKSDKGLEPHSVSNHVFGDSFAGVSQYYQVRGSDQAEIQA